jgi:hypothetical protein
VRLPTFFQGSAKHWGTDMSDPKRNHGGDALIDALFVEARAEAAPGADLLARILDDAYRLQPVAPAPGPVRRGGGWFGDLADALGGWRGAGGLATATVAGLWIGLSDTAWNATGLATALGSATVESLEVFPGASDIAGLTAAEG